MDNQTNLYQEAAFDAAKKMKFVKLKRLLETNENFDINICDWVRTSYM